MVKNNLKKRLKLSLMTLLKVKTDQKEVITMRKVN